MREDYKDVLGGDVEKVETNSPPLIYIFIFIFFYTFIKKKKKKRERIDWKRQEWSTCEV